MSILSVLRGSTSLNRRSENVIVEAIIIAELELCNVKVKVPFADVVESPHDAALEDAPKAFNGVGVNRADDVLVLGMVDSCVRESPIEVSVAGPLIGAEQANLVRDGFANEGFQGDGANVLNDAGNDIAFAADSTSNNCFTRGDASRPAVALIPVPVMSLGRR
jgi:hypothetical protein